MMTQPNFQPFFFLLASLSWSGSKCDQPVRARPEQTQAGGVVVEEVEVGVFELLPERQTERNGVAHAKYTRGLILRTK